MIAADAALAGAEQWIGPAVCFFQPLTGKVHIETFSSSTPKNCASPRPSLAAGVNHACIKKREANCTQKGQLKQVPPCAGVVLPLAGLMQDPGETLVGPLHRCRAEEGAQDAQGGRVGGHRCA